jgi:hypothetical protein
MRILIALAGVCLAALPARTQSPNLYTIPNQSAHFVRMPSRESSTEIDAVFHNPAGTIELPEGFHLTINNQGLVQTSRVTSDYAELNDVPTTYEGVASSLVFPSMFAAWRKGRVAFHGGLLMVGGTGGAAYDNLPEADAGIADIVPILLTPALVPLGAANAQITAATGTDPGYLDLDGYRFAFNSEGLGFSPGLQLGRHLHAGGRGDLQPHPGRLVLALRLPAHGGRRSQPQPALSLRARGRGPGPG